MHTPGRENAKPVTYSKRPQKVNNLLLHTSVFSLGVPSFVYDFFLVAEIVRFPPHVNPLAPSVPGSATPTEIHPCS